MIKVQLAPFGELEDKNWWAVDAAVLMLLGLLTHYLAGAYLDIKRNETTALLAKKARWEQELEAKGPALKQFESLEPEIAKLNQKISALQRITTSKLDKVKPLVAMDQLQTLAIQGVWYERLEYTAEGGVTILGSANDSLLIGEYMLGVRESMNPETYNDDIRTQIGFDNLKLKNAILIDTQDDFFRDVKLRMRFEISGQHMEKKPLVHGVAISPPPRARANF
jgi:hypothetical protein